MNVLARFVNRHGDTILLVADARGRRTTIEYAAAADPAQAWDGGLVARLDAAVAAATEAAHAVTSPRSAGAEVRPHGWHDQWTRAACTAAS